MTTSTSTRERRDWTLLIFLIPIGIIFMLIAGQVAIRLVPIWSINAGMQSNLDPNNLPMRQSGPIQPILPAILTPLGWFDTFLTPGAGTGDDVVFPPFIIFEPTITPVVTTPPPTVVVTPSPTIPATISPTVVVTPSPTRTPRPTDEPTSNPPTPTPTEPVGIYVPPPIDIGVDTPPDGTPGEIASGTYTVIDISNTPLYVDGLANYDLIFYESLYDPTTVQMDQIIIAISHNADGSDYYEVFNWGDNIPDTNTNIDPALQPENDNAPIQTSDLYTDPVTGISTGILIDVDTAPSAPPEGTYNYLVIICPLNILSPDPAQVDSVVVIPP
jgi:hypothetical protein